MGLCTLLPQLNLDQSIPTLSCLDHSIPPLNCLDHSIPFRSRYTVGTVWVLDQSYSVQNCLDLGIRNFLDQNPHPFLDLSHRDQISIFTSRLGQVLVEASVDVLVVGRFTFLALETKFWFARDSFWSVSD